MTGAEKMLEALGFKFDSADDYGKTAFCAYKKDFTTVNFSLLKDSGEWKAEVYSFDHDVDEYSFPHPFDVRLARSIVRRLEELNKSWTQWSTTGGLRRKSEAIE